MNHTFRGCFLIAATAACTAAFAQPTYSNLYVFGDSLSDVGNDLLVTGGAVPTASYYTDGSATGRFTNGLSYADHLAAGLGLSLTASLTGGTDYAYGGARLNTVNAGLPPTALSFNQQLASYETTHAQADPNALYVLWIGANDMSDAILARAGGDTTAIPTAIGVTTQGIAGAIQALAASGATHFLVPNLPDLSLTPAARSFGSAQLSALAHGASVGFNAALAGTLAPLEAAGTLDIRSFDVLGLQTTVTNNPGAYGFSDVSAACYTGEVDGTARPAGGPAPTVCASPGSYMYWDYEHPTAALHVLLGEAALAAAVPEPATWLMMALGLGGLLLRRRR